MRTTTGNPVYFVSDTTGVRFSDRPGTFPTPANPQPKPFDRHTSKHTTKRQGRLVVGVDGTDASLAALRRGAELATQLHHTLVVVTAWHYIVDPWGSDITMAAGRDAAGEVLDTAMDAVFGDVLPRWVSGLIVEGPADQVLLEQSVGAQMLIVGSRGHAGLAGVLFGSVSASCAERGSCAVLVVH
jgi:nucleotide-binding universal stress UspA family protein